MMTDPISDMLTRIRNAMAIGQRQTVVPYSKIKTAIADILKANGYIDEYKVEESGPFKQIVIELPEDGARITKLERISKPGRRIYASCDDIPVVLSGRGLVIISTPGGIMSGQDAKKRRLGGELICKVW